MHGKTSEVRHDGKTIFAGLPSPMTATRYHSLIVEEKNLALRFRSQRLYHRERWIKDNHGPAASESFPIEGVQFHPESVLTVEGKKLVRNFLQLKTQ